MRVILDSNVLLSALISPHGAPHAIYAAWLKNRFELITCSEHRSMRFSGPAAIQA
jgi:predicted nucleic acid-binding protein